MLLRKQRSHENQGGIVEDQGASRFNERFSNYILPITLLILGYLAQQNYTRIISQLDRIEQRQGTDMVLIAELKLRILNLEQALKPAPANQQPPPPTGRNPASFRPGIVYSQS